METEIFNMVGSVGFPILCCVYLMTKIDNTLKENTAVINKLSTTMQVILNELGKKDE